MEKTKKPDIKAITQQLIRSNVPKFSFVVSGGSRQVGRLRKIEHVYSKNEIKELVREHLIAEYQQERIIEAVTDYLYGIHVSVGH